MKRVLFQYSVKEFACFIRYSRLFKMLRYFLDVT